MRGVCGRATVCGEAELQPRPRLKAGDLTGSGVDPRRRGPGRCRQPGRGRSSVCYATEDPKMTHSAEGDGPQAAKRTVAGGGDDYVRRGGGWRHLTPLSAGAKARIDEWRPQIEHLHGLAACHRDAVRYLRSCVNVETTEFQLLIMAGHGSVALFLRDALCLIKVGSVTSATLLLRPAVERMIDLQYLKRFPRETSAYFSKVSLRNSRTDARSSTSPPKGSLRFKSIEEVVSALRVPAARDAGNTERELLTSWNALSDAALHWSSDLAGGGFESPPWEWKNALAQLRQVALTAIGQLFAIDEGLESHIDRERELRKRALSLSFSVAAVPQPGER